MTRILGHLPELFERFEASVVTFLDLPPQGSHAAKGIRPVLACAPQRSVAGDSRATRMSSRIVSSPTPGQSRAQLTEAGETMLNSSLTPHIGTSRAPVLAVVRALDAGFALGCAPAAAHYTAA